MAAKYERISLMVLIAGAFYASQDWFFTIPYASLVSAALLFRQLLHSYVFWSAVVALQGYCAVQLWLDSESSILLFFYLGLTVLVASLSPKPSKVLTRNARLIVGVIFLLTTFWKLVGDGFISGDFLSYYLLHERRLSPIAVLLTDLTYADVLANRALLDDVWEGQVTLRSTPQVERLAAFLTWSTLILEALISLLFIIPLKVLQGARDVALIGFLFTAYLVLPVPAFGMALACLGYAQAETAKFQILYLVAFIAMPLTTLRYYLLP